MQIININTVREHANEKLCISEELENEFIGLLKYLFFSQMSEQYEKVEFVRLFSSYLNLENRELLEEFMDENPNLKSKYQLALLPQPLKKSAN